MEYFEVLLVLIKAIYVASENSISGKSPGKEGLDYQSTANTSVTDDGNKTNEGRYGNVTSLDIIADGMINSEGRGGSFLCFVL